MFVLRYFSALLFECLVVVDDALFNLGLDTRNPIFGVSDQVLTHRGGSRIW